MLATSNILRDIFPVEAESCRFCYKEALLSERNEIGRPPLIAAEHATAVKEVDIVRIYT